MYENSKNLPDNFDDLVAIVDWGHQHPKGSFCPRYVYELKLKRSCQGIDNNFVFKSDNGTIELAKQDIKDAKLGWSRKIDKQLDTQDLEMTDRGDLVPRDK